MIGGNRKRGEGGERERVIKIWGGGGSGGKGRGIRTTRGTMREWGVEGVDSTSRIKPFETARTASVKPF